MPIVDVLRHGALVGGVRYRGRTDDPLTDEGRRQMERVWERVQGEVEVIITSPLSRCREPAQAWARARGLPLVVEERLVELAYGAWEGKTAQEIEAEYGALFRRWRENPAGLRPPGGEAPEELWARVADWWEDFRRQEMRRALVVTHSGPLRVLVSLVLGGDLAMTRRLHVPYACCSRIGGDAHASWLVFHNCS